MSNSTNESTKFSSKKELMSFECPPDKKQFEVWHTDGKGFGARIMRPSKRTGLSTRTYLYRWKDADGGDHKEKLGRFEEIKYEDAQTKAGNLRQEKKDEKNPNALKPLPTLQRAFDTYLKERNDELKESSIEDYKKKFEYLKPYAEENVGLLDSDWWWNRYEELLERGRPTADAVLRLAHAIYQNLVNDEKVLFNPVRRIVAKKKIYKKGKPKTPALKTRELPLLWNWLETRAHSAVRDLVRIQLFMGLRDAVAGNLRWENVDMKLRLLQVPAEERGNKANVLVWVPMCNWLFENVFKPRYAARLPNSPWVIPSPKKAGQPLADVRGSMCTMQAETKVYASPHILRRTFSTVGLLAIRSDILVSRMLTHTSKSAGQTDAPTVTAGYITPDEDIMRKCFNDTATLMLAYCRGEVTREFDVETADVEGLEEDEAATA